MAIPLDKRGIWDAFEARVDELTRRCLHLQEEVSSLHEQRLGWEAERAALLERYGIARTRMEAMVSRLKLLESSAVVQEQ